VNRTPNTVVKGLSISTVFCLIVACYLMLHVSASSVKPSPNSKGYSKKAHSVRYRSYMIMCILGLNFTGKCLKGSWNRYSRSRKITKICRIRQRPCK